MLILSKGADSLPASCNMSPHGPHSPCKSLWIHALPSPKRRMRHSSGNGALGRDVYVHPIYEATLNSADSSSAFSWNTASTYLSQWRASVVELPKT